MPDLVVLAPFGMRPKATLSRRALPLLEPLAAQGWSIHVLAPADLFPADAGTTLMVGGITVEHGPLWRGPLAMLRSSLWMYRRTLALRPRLVHLFKPKGYGALAALALRRSQPRLPLVLDTDDWEGWGGWNERLPYPQPLKLLIDWLEHALPRQLAAVTAASRTLEQQVLVYGAAPARTRYLPNSVTLPAPPLPARAAARAMLGIPPEQPVALLYTRFWEFAVADVAACLAGLATARPELRLLVVGAGEQGEEQQLAALAQRAGLSAQLDLRGWADRPLIDAALAAADVALYPMDDTLLNRAKCSAKLTEQMQAGLPLVAARVGQVAEYIEDGHSGLLVPPGSGGALAQGVLRLLADPALARRLGAGARQRIEQHFTWPQRAAELAALYAQLLEA